MAFCCAENRKEETPLDWAAGGVKNAGDGLLDGIGKVGDGIMATPGLIYDGASGTVKFVGDVGAATVEAGASAATATAEGVVFAGSAIVGGIESTFEKLGAVAGFQAVFGADIDKSDENLTKIFKEVDTDKSGRISSAEMDSLVEKLYGKKLDDKVLAEMMAKADTDKDGQIDLREFIAIMRAGPEKAPNMLGF